MFEVFYGYGLTRDKSPSQTWGRETHFAEKLPGTFGALRARGGHSRRSKGAKTDIAVTPRDFERAVDGTCCRLSSGRAQLRACSTWRSFPLVVGASVFEKHVSAKMTASFHMDPGTQNSR